jgi:cell shape-determining protein MreD
MKRRVLILAIAALLLIWLLGQLNHYLAVWQIQVWCGGLLVAFTGLRMGYRTGATAAFVAGLLLDAGEPVAFGTQALLLLAAHAVIFTVRNRAPREEILVGVVFALIANLGLFLALCFLRIDTSFDPGAVWMRAFADLLVSQIVLAVVAPWFFALQIRLLAISGNHPRELSHRAI